MSQVGRALAVMALVALVRPADARAQSGVTAQPLQVVDVNDAPSPLEPRPTPAATVTRESTARPRRPSYVGLTFDLGMPDIMGLALAVRPIWWLRLQAGASTDLFSGGLGGAVTFVPMRRLLSPSITVAGGHVFSSETLGVPHAFNADAAGVLAEGRIVGYDYASAHAGLEIGAQKRINISIQAGASFVNLTSVPDGTHPTNFTTATLRVWSPSGRVALTVFL